ncbi:MAG: diguanylate cyclase [Candidatus Nanopelagicales bacterium]
MTAPANGRPHLDRPDLDHAVEIAPRIWWVGSVLEDDDFQSHAYLVEAGNHSALVDPGSPLTIDETLRKVREVVPLEAIRWVVCHHADPDVVAALPLLDEVLTHPDVTVVSEWRAAALLVHYGSSLPILKVEQHDWQIPLDDGRRLQFQLTPYLHFPGALVSYEEQTGVLFSADLFGGFVPDPTRLVMHDADEAFEAIRPFHEHYMPSRELLAAGLHRIRRRFPRITMIAPQHGHVLPEPLVEPTFARLERLECGVFRFAEEDLDLAWLLRVSEVRRQVSEVLLGGVSAPTMFTAVRALLAAVLPVDGLAVFVDLPDEGWVRLDASSGFAGVHVPAPPGPSPSSLLMELAGDPVALAGLWLSEPTELDPSLVETLRDLAPSMRIALDRFLDERADEAAIARLEEESRVDPLTGLLNRRGLERSLPTGRYALVLLDLDRFKDVNDTFGHDAGDEVLRRTAGALRRAVRQQDIVARIGGEELVAVVVDAGAEQGRYAAERIRTSIRALDVRGLAPGDRVTASAGVAVVTAAEARDPQAFARAFARADDALYRAKEDGRDRVELATPDDGAAAPEPG